MSLYIWAFLLALSMVFMGIAALRPARTHWFYIGWALGCAAIGVRNGF